MSESNMHHHQHQHGSLINNDVYEDPVTPAFSGRPEQQQEDEEDLGGSPSEILDVMSSMEQPVPAAVPGYLRSTFSLSVPDTNESAEIQRIRQTFGRGSFSTLKQLPDLIKPEAIKDKMKLHALKNQLGTMYTHGIGPDGLGIHAFKVPGLKTAHVFHPVTYIPTDYDKSSDLNRAKLEEERNQNASYSKKPFKTSDTAIIPNLVPHDFAVDKKKFKKPKEVEGYGGVGVSVKGVDAEGYFEVDMDNDDDINVQLQKRAVHKKIEQLTLGLVVRDEYSVQNKQKFLAGDFRSAANGMISGSVDQPRFEYKKTNAMLKDWAKILYGTLNEDWSNLTFKITLDGNRSSEKNHNHNHNHQNRTVSAGAVSTTGSNRSSNQETSPPTAKEKDHQSNRIHVGGDLTRVRSDQILVQFDTESQTLPPLNALTKYMSTMSTHGKANQLGLRRRCDRWAVVEPGLIKRPVLEIDDQSMIIRIEECGMVKTITRRPCSRDQTNGNSSVYSPHESGSMSTTHPPIVWHDGGEGEEIEETVVVQDTQQSARLLLYKKIPTAKVVVVHPHLHGTGPSKSPQPAVADNSSKLRGDRDYPTPLQHSSSQSAHHFPSSSAGGGMRDVAAAYVQKALVQSGVDRDLLSSSQRAEITKTSTLTERSERPGYRGSFAQKQHQVQRSFSGLPRPDSAQGGQGTSELEHADYPSMLAKFKLLTSLQLDCTRTDTDASLDQEEGGNDRHGDSPVASGITPHPSNHVTYYDINGHAHTILDAISAPSSPLSSPGKPSRAYQKHGRGVISGGGSPKGDRKHMGSHISPPISPLSSPVRSMHKGNNNHNNNNNNNQPSGAVRPRSSPTRSNRAAFVTGGNGTSPSDSINTPFGGKVHPQDTTGMDSGYLYDKNNNHTRSSHAHFKLSFEESTHAMSIISSLEKQFHDFFAVSSNIPSNHNQDDGNHNNHPIIINTAISNTPTVIIRSQISLTVTVTGPWEPDTKTGSSPPGHLAHGPVLTTSNPNAPAVAFAPQNGSSTSGDGVPSSSIHFLDDLGLDEVIEDDDPPPPTPPPANVGIHTRLRHLMKESRKSVVMGAELSNLRSFRVRAREESQARQMQAALQWERQSNTHKYLSKRRRMNVQTIVVRNTADNHAEEGLHALIDSLISSILLVAGLPDLKTVRSLLLHTLGGSAGSSYPSSHQGSQPGTRHGSRHGSRHASLQMNPVAPSHLAVSSTRRVSIQLTPRTPLTPSSPLAQSPRQGLAPAPGQGLISRQPSIDGSGGVGGGGGILRGTSCRFPPETLNINNTPSNNNIPQNYYNSLEEPPELPDDERLEQRSDGMKETTLLTYAFYAPWVQVSQLSASIQAAHSIRHKVREHRGDESKAKKVLRERMEMALFGVANIPHHITSKVLARDGGINAFRDYIPEIVHEVEESVPEFRLDQFFGSNSPMGQSKVATVAGGLSSSAVRRSSSSSNVSHVPTGTPAGTARTRSGSVMHFPSSPTQGPACVGVSRAPSMFFSSNLMGTTPANTTTPSFGGPNLNAAIAAAAAASANQANNQRQSMSGGTEFPTKRGVSARGVGFNLGGTSSSARNGQSESTKNNPALNPTLARQLNVRGLETVTMLLAEMGDNGGNGSTMRSTKSTNNFGNRHNSVNNATMTRPKSALTMVANGNPNNVTTEGISSIDKENQHHQQPSNNMALPTMGEPEEELDAVAIAAFKQSTITETYREVRALRTSAREHAEIILGRKSLVPIRDMAGSVLLSKRSANRWKK